MKRRKFLLSGSASALALGLFPLEAVFSTPGSTSRRKLILVELTGGNDGLSMVAPRASKTLKVLRPTLALPSQSLIPVNADLGLHSSLAGLLPTLKAGNLAIVNNVGYLPSDRSHFRSLDIWHSGVSKRMETHVGWLGRQLALEKKTNPKHKMSLFHLGSGPLPLCFAGAPHPVTALQSLSDLKLGGRKNTAKKIAAANVGADKDVSDLDFLKKSTKDALVAAKKCEGITATDTLGFSTDSFGKQMSLVASLSSAFEGDQVFFTNITGFDTHAVQNETQPILLKSLGRGLTTLMTKLKQQKDTNFTILVYSEFGRRVKENASKGTDHGAAGPCLVLGNHVKGGIFGGPIDLQNLMNGDLRPTTDFRSVYAELVSGSLGMKSKSLRPEFGPKLGLITRT